MTKDDYIKKLERRIHNQRVQLAWWDDNFAMHTHNVIMRKLLSKRSEIRESVLAVEKLRES